VSWAAGLPREADRDDMRYQWISRQLANKHIDTDEVMAGFARDVLEAQAKSGEAIDLMMDQSKLSDRHQVLMLAVRYGNRALPLAWRVEVTSGNIGFDVQKGLLDVVAKWMPEGAKLCLMADRFYGTPDLIGWCKTNARDYRIRLKGNLKVFDGSPHTSTGEMANAGAFATKNVELTAKKITTNIGIIQDPNHDEPWIIAQSNSGSADPGYLKTLDYAKRWGVEAMFSDFKSRGFGIEDIHIYHADRLSRLVLVMSLALYAAVSTGLHDATQNPSPAEKKTRKTDLVQAQQNLQRSFNVPKYRGSHEAYATSKNSS
jgi:Transposase DDE domain